MGSFDEYNTIIYYGRFHTDTSRWDKQYTRIPYENYEIPETDYRYKTAKFTSTHYIDLTKGRVAVHIASDSHDNFGGIILGVEREDSGLYTYSCQDWNRIWTQKIYWVAQSEKTTVYEVIKKLLKNFHIPDTGLLPLKAYKNTAIKEKTTVTSTNTIDTSTSSTSTDTSSDTDDSDSDTETTPIKIYEGVDNIKEGEAYNPMAQTINGIWDKVTMGDFIRSILFDNGVYIDVYLDANGVPHFDPYNKDNWLGTGWYFTTPQLAEETLNFDITNIITNVDVKNQDPLSTDFNRYNSKKELGVDLAAFYGEMITTIDNPVQATSSTSTDTGVDDGNSITAENVHGLCGKCGYTPTVTVKWKNYCPDCKKSGALIMHPSSGGPDYEVSCRGTGGCGADFCPKCGRDLKPQAVYLTKAGSSTTSTTSTSTTSTSTNSTGTDDATSGSTTVDTTSADDIEKEKELAMTAMTESVRDLLTFKIKFPGAFKNLHTNSFIWTELPTDFVLSGMSETARAMEGQYTRYAGYKLNRWYVEGVTVSCSDGELVTELTLNPFASAYSTYTQIKKDAINALNDALNGGDDSGGSVNSDGSMNEQQIWNWAKTVAYNHGNSSHDPKTAYTALNGGTGGDCYSLTAALYYLFNFKAGIKAQDVCNKGSGTSGSHHWIQIWKNGAWYDPVSEYRQYTSGNYHIISKRSNPDHVCRESGGSADSYPEYQRCPYSNNG